MRPALSPPHGTGLGTTAGITAVIAVVAAVAVVGQCRGVQGLDAVLGAGAAALLIAGAGLLYTGRNFIGAALDLAAADAAQSGIAAARGLTFFHLGMAGVFAGAGFAAAAAFAPLAPGSSWLALLVAVLACGAAIGQAAGWSREARRRRAVAGDRGARGGAAAFSKGGEYEKG